MQNFGYPLSKKVLFIFYVFIISPVFAFEEQPFDPSHLSSKQPSKPLNIKVINTTANELHLTWSKPQNENGEISGYRVYYMNGNYTDVRTSASTVLSYTLSALKPYTEYKIWVKAFTYKNEGYPSDAVIHRTDVSGPSMPILINASCQANDSIYMEWIKPTEYNISIDQYSVFYKKLGEDETDVITIDPIEFSPNEPIYRLIADLHIDAVYEVFVVGYTKSTYNSDILIPGDRSDKRVIDVKTDCDKPILVPAGMFDFLSPLLICIIGVSAISFAVFLCCCFCVCKFHKRIRLAFRRFGGEGKWDENGKTHVVAMRHFPAHVASMHSDGDLGFSKEYEAIQRAVVPGELTSIVSENPENKLKNRYLNILAYDHTRVKFVTQPGQECQDEYINANFIDGFEKKAAYIGTQGPLPLTFACFWRMVWEQDVCIIVMITNLIERGRRKCDMYWPREDSEAHGNVNVTLEKEDIRATYTVRTFRIRLMKAVPQDKKKKTLPSGDRVVKQFHYTNWPDHGTPDHALPILRFIHKSSSANPSDGGPIIVHCSAGVGRTGAYIVLDSMLKMIHAKKEVDVYKFLKHIRSQRNFLVQTEEQYIFIHDALVEAIESGDTCIHQAYMKRYLNKLLARRDRDKNENLIKLEEQYKLATSFKPMEYHFLSARKSMNIMKNGENLLLPMEAFRVHLSPKPGLEGSDYLNASWFMGYHRLHEYIVAGAPCDNSLIDFWQMMWDHSVRTIAMFINFEESDIEPFWPVGDEIIMGDTFQLKMSGEGEDEGILYREFALSSASGEFDWTLRIYYYPTWPRSTDPIITAFDAVNKVEDYNKQLMHGPIVLVDRLGCSQAATFCALSSLSKQIQCEGFADVYTFVKLYHMCRPGCWLSSNDLLFLYQATVALAVKLPATTVPMVLPEFEGLGPTPHVHANGKAISYVRSRSPSSNFHSLDDDMVTPELESMCPNNVVHSNGFATQDNYLRDVIISEETKLTVELLHDLQEEDEEEEMDEELDEIELVDIV